MQGKYGETDHIVLACKKERKKKSHKTQQN